MDSVAVIDFGGQYAHLLANRCRRLGVFSEIVLPETPLKRLASFKGLILSGGPESVYARGAPRLNRRVFSLGIPVLGICYGHQIIAHLLGGKVSPGITKEYGFAKLSMREKIGVFEGIHDDTQVWMSHGDTISRLPPHFVHIGETSDCRFAAMGDPKRKIFSTQFHVEVKHTHEGIKILDNFLRMCGVKREWNIEHFFKEKIEEMKEKLAGRKVFLLVSGGVDSTVCYAFLSKILGEEKVFGLFVDTGFLRKDEANHIRKALKRIGIKKLHVMKAQKRFFDALKGVVDPEEKRKIIGDMFLAVQADEVKKLEFNPAEWVLGQGTIYPDTIESAGTKYADRIKTHHNRVPEILKLIKEGKVIEPLAELYKDEVRALGEKLGLPREIVWRHPFPGPGLAVRMLCAKGKKLPEQRQKKKIKKLLDNELSSYGLQGKVLPLQSVGVQGDARTYRHPLAVWGKEKSFKKLEILSTVFTNRYPLINRVCLLLKPREITAIKIIPATLTKKRTAFLQRLDDLVMRFIKKNKIERAVWQFPTVLLPLQINGIKKESVILRPICSDEAMTAHFYKMHWQLLQKLTKLLQPHVSAIFYDITNKPPGTIEWE